MDLCYNGNTKRKTNMKPTKDYIKNINRRTITTQMLEDCLYSVNKRAKNCRDKVNEYKGWREQYRNLNIWNYVKKYYDKKDEYYAEKEVLLKLLKPYCIHVEKAEFWHDFKKSKYNKYYLFYKMPHRSFHTPLDFINREHRDWNDEDKLRWIGENYGELPIVKLTDNILTQGHDVGDLISCQFVKKVIDLIKRGNYTYIEESESTPPPTIEQEAA